MKPKNRSEQEKGAVLVTIALSSVVLLGACGLAVDIGRMYVVHSELQNLCDSAALAAALQLDGTGNGVKNARAEIQELRERNQLIFGTKQLEADGLKVEFGTWSSAAAAPGSWQLAPSEDPAIAVPHSYVRVTTTTPVPIYFMTVFEGVTSSNVRAVAIAGQLPTVNPQGLFPFTPMAHSTVGPDFGLEPGKEYTLRWASSPKLSKGNLCGGDFEDKWIDADQDRGSQNRGFYGSNSAADLYDQVANDAPVKVYQIGDYIDLTGGAKTAVKKAIVERIRSDSNETSSNITSYAQTGNGRRLITCPITDPFSTPKNRVLGYGRFLLKTEAGYDDETGNDPWCAIYLGPGAAEGAKGKGGFNQGGLTKVRLWQ